MKKKMATLVALAMTTVMTLSMMACGGTTTPSSSEGGNAPAKETEAPAAGTEEASMGSYQLTGKYAEEGNGADRVSAAFKLDLNEDGTVVVDRYRFMSDTYEDTFMTGTWAPAQKDGIDCLKIDLACDNNGTKSNEQTVYAYDVAGVYSVEISFPIVVGMDYKRSLTVEGSSEKKYDDDSFREANLYTAPETEAPAAETEAPAAETEAPAAETEAAAEGGENAPAAEGEVSAFAGEYDVENTNGEGEKAYFEEFIIDEDGTVHGAVDASGLTGFTGTVDAEGKITAEFGRLGGTMTGTVDAEGKISGSSEVRGRKSTFTGEKFE
ncbi:MAG: hypothetical protein IKQ24_01305 [Verrucomicrobia bacterium]|nr:hypothetical protein [Lachnospiraceae bacterium]MBR4248772.1 hypothetical protein [Verrucomicrobiota bacterium]